MFKISFFSTILFQFLLVLNLKLLDNTYLILSLFSTFILIGLFFKVVFKKSNLQQCFLVIEIIGALLFFSYFYKI